MIIKSVHLTNFRNHDTYHLVCDDNTSLILGANGCGKTSVLEAIYILTRGKSFRATDPDIIKRGTPFYRAELAYQSGEVVTATYDGKVKNFTTLNKKTKRLPKDRKYPVVLFLPQDLNLVSHSPGSRRDYFNRIFNEFSELYATSLNKYDKALKQRNEILKNNQITRNAIFSWNMLLAKYGTDLRNLRKEFIQEFNLQLTKVYQSISENSDQIYLDYQTEVNDTSVQGYLDKLENNFNKDCYLGHTSFGVHRDDYVVRFNQKIANGSASRGETRSIILALKFIEADLIYQKTHKRPLVLLDDVFSELDPTRRRHLVNNFKDNQVIITSVEDIQL